MTTSALSPQARHRRSSGRFARRSEARGQPGRVDFRAYKSFTGAVAAADRELDLAAALGAEREASTQVLSLYIPNKDRHGRPIRTAPWIREAQDILTRIGEGYTTTPPHDGGWETGGGQVRRERTVIVYTYIKPERFLAQAGALREFLHRFGRETDQEVVVAELSGADGSWFFRIKEYDERRRYI